MNARDAYRLIKSAAGLMKCAAPLLPFGTGGAYTQDAQDARMQRAQQFIDFSRHDPAWELSYSNPAIRAAIGLNDPNAIASLARNKETPDYSELSQMDLINAFGSSQKAPQVAGRVSLGSPAPQPIQWGRQRNDESEAYRGPSDSWTYGEVPRKFEWEYGNSRPVLEDDSVDANTGEPSSLNYTGYGITDYDYPEIIRSYGGEKQLNMVLSAYPDAVRHMQSRYLADPDSWNPPINEEDFLIMNPDQRRNSFAALQDLQREFDAGTIKPVRTRLERVASHLPQLREMAKRYLNQDELAELESMESAERTAARRVTDAPSAESSVTSPPTTEFSSNGPNFAPLQRSNQSVFDFLDNIAGEAEQNRVASRAEFDSGRVEWLEKQRQWEEQMSAMQLPAANSLVRIKPETPEVAAPEKPVITVPQNSKAMPGISAVAGAAYGTQPYFTDVANAMGPIRPGIRGRIGNTTDSLLSAGYGLAPRLSPQQPTAAATKLPGRTLTPPATPVSDPFANNPFGTAPTQTANILAAAKQIMPGTQPPRGPDNSAYGGQQQKPAPKPAPKATTDWSTARSADEMRAGAAAERAYYDKQHQQKMQQPPQTPAFAPRHAVTGTPTATKYNPRGLGRVIEPKVDLPPIPDRNTVTPDGRPARMGVNQFNRDHRRGSIY